MLDTEPQNRQPDPNEPEGNRQGSGQESNQRRGLLRRTRRSVGKPGEAPAFSSGAQETQEGAGQRPGPDAQPGGAQSGGGQGTGRATGPVPVVPVVPSAQPAERRDQPAPAQQRVPAASFQAPVVVFQPPDLTERRPAESARARQDTGATVGSAGPSAGGDSGDDSEGQSGASRRRRRGGRGRGKGSAGESAAGSDQASPGQAGTGQGSAGQNSAGQGGAGQGGAGQGGAGQGGASSSRSTQGSSGQNSAGQSSGRQAGAADSSAGQAGGDQRRGAGDRSEAGRPDQGRRDGLASGEGDGAELADDDAADGDAAGSSSSRRRRRRRQRGGSVAAEADVPAADDPTDTVVHVREPRPPAESDDVRAVKGSTRLEAKRQRRRESRDTGRRRPPIISESEFLARREAVERVMLVRQQGDRTQIAVLEDGILVEHYVDKASHQSYVGNVYLGKVQNVLPSMEAAFVDIGKGRNAVLYAGEVNFDATGLEGVAKRIESALRSGQSIMVQVTKDPIGHKGARLTSQVSLPGRYLVYVPGASMTGISRKLPDTERARLKQILKKVAPEEGGIIVRTAAEGATESELLHDVTRLVAQWQAIERKAKTASAPDLLYGEPDLTIRVVRDIFNEDFTKLVIASDSEWDLVDEYVRYVAPNLADRLERWTPDADGDLFAAYRIDEQLAKALDRKVWLPSGGSLVIDTTEAMTVIDVNTGKFTGQGGNLEQTVTRNNLEAAEEIVRQLRLRDIGGIIVIDFIDMVLESNRDLVLRRLIECLARDRTKHQVAEVTSLGLVQMTRKRVGTGLLAAFSVPCEHCGGRGVLISADLTELPQPHGRNGQQATAKPGPARSRSARSKAIAQVAAKTLDMQQSLPEDVNAHETVASPGGADGSSGADGQAAAVSAVPAEAGGDEAQVASASGTAKLDPAESGPAESGPAESGPAESGPAESGPAESGPAESGPAESGTSRSGAGRSGAARSGAARSGPARSRRPEPAVTELTAVVDDQPDVEPSPNGSADASRGAGWPVVVAEADLDEAAVVTRPGSQSFDGESDPPESSRRRVRRSAYREAGPPDSAQSEPAHSEPARADAVQSDAVQSEPAPAEAEIVAETVAGGDQEGGANQEDGALRVDLRPAGEAASGHADDTGIAESHPAESHPAESHPAGPQAAEEPSSEVDDAVTPESVTPEPVTPEPVTPELDSAGQVDAAGEGVTADAAAPHAEGEQVLTADALAPARQPGESWPNPADGR